MTTRQYIAAGGAALALLAASFVAGRYTASPEKVTVRTEGQVRVEYRDRVVERKVEGPVRVQVVTRTIQGPAGPERVVVRTVERGPVTTDRAEEGQGAASQAFRAVTIKEAQPRWLLGASAGLALGSTAPVWGGQLMYRLAGPVWVGAAADSAGSLRAQLALTF